MLGVDHHRRHRGEHPERGGAQRVGAHPLERVGFEEAVRLFGTGAPRHAALGTADAGVERGGRVLERLALEQPGEQQVALLEAEQLLVELGVFETGEEAAGLELHEGGGDEQELGGDVEVEGLPARFMRSSSARYASTIADSDTSHSSTSSRRMRWSSRSNGPS